METKESKMTRTVELTLVQMSEAGPRGIGFSYSSVFAIGHIKSFGLGNFRASSIEEAQKSLQMLFGVPENENPWVPSLLGWSMSWTFEVK